MATLYDSTGTEIGRVSVDGTFIGAGNHRPGTRIDMGSPEGYVFRFGGEGSRVKEGGDYRVDFDDGRSVHLRVSRVYQVGGSWMLSCEVEKPGSEA